MEDRVSRQQMRSAVNFGVAALAAATGAETHEALRLRCECGAPTCTALIPIELADYQRAPLTDALLVVPKHASASAITLATNVLWSVVALDR